MCTLSCFSKHTQKELTKKEAQLKTENVIDKEQDGIEQLKNALNELLFTDSQSLLNKDEEQLQHINSMTTMCRKYYMKANIQKKTEAMKITKTLSPTKYINTQYKGEHVQDL